jgi:hypothetical protein
VGATVSLVTAPIVFTPATAAAATPTFCVRAYANLEVKIAGHVTKHITPDVIEEIKVIVETVIPVISVAMVIIPRHIDGSSTC